MHDAATPVESLLKCDKIAMPNIAPTLGVRSDIEISLDDLPTLDQVRHLWMDLEQRSKPSFFTSWAWIGTWLELLPAEIHPQLLQARLAGRVVGLAVVVQGPPRRRFGMVVCHTAHLHATGRSELDILSIEHNDFLLETGSESEVRAAMLAHWLDRLPLATEVSLPWLAGNGWPPGIESAARRRITRMDSVCRSYAINLEAVREADGDYLKLLSYTTRKYARRSMRAYSQSGLMVLEAACSPEQGLIWLDHLAELHQARWLSRGQPGCFSNDFFTRFHQTMVARHLADGCVQLLRIRVAEKDMAYLYGFVRDKRVYSYQTGLNYDMLESSNQPGMVAHVLAGQYNAAIGNDVFDLMAGESPNKPKLSTFTECMTCTVMRTDSWRFDLEALLLESGKTIRSVRAKLRRFARGVRNILMQGSVDRVG